MSLEYAIEDLIDTLEESLDNLKDLNSCDVELYDHIWGNEEDNNYLSTLYRAHIDISNAIYDFVNDIDYESGRLKKSNSKSLPTLAEWVMKTLNDIDLNDKSAEKVYNQIYSKLTDDNANKVMIGKIFIDHFKDEECKWDTTRLIDTLDTTINSMLNNDNYEHLVAFVENIPFKMPIYNNQLEDQYEEYFSPSERIATALVYQLEPIADMVLEYVNSKDLYPDQEEDYDM